MVGVFRGYREKQEPIWGWDQVVFIQNYISRKKSSSSAV